MNNWKNDYFFTPTSYGSVISQIGTDHNLKRLYLDNDATKRLMSDSYVEIIKEIKKHGIYLKDFKKLVPNFINNYNKCKELVSKNKWLLFSLKPLQISVQTVNYCNAKCSFCYANAPSIKSKRNIDITNVRKLKDYAAENGIKFGISGGEPLLHPKIYDILSYKKDQVYDTLITNLLSDYDQNKLIKSEPDLIQISMHGYKESHDKNLKIKGAYEKVKKRMKSLVKHLILATNTVITPDNLGNIEKMVDDLNQFQIKTGKKLKYLRFVPVIPSGFGIAKYKTEKAFFEKSKSLLLKLMNSYKDIEFEIPMIHSNPYEYFKKDNKWVCPAGSTVAVVRIDGKMIPCNQFLDTKINTEDSIYNKEIENIWINDSLFSKLRQGIDMKSDNHQCSQCSYLLFEEKKTKK